MSQRYEETEIERAIARAFGRGLRAPRLSRRAFLGNAGRGVVAAGATLSLPAILAACGIGPQGGSGASAGGDPNLLMFANWPFYIDQDEETGDRPSLDQFTDETGIAVDYREVIEDNESFFGTIQPALAAGQSTGWDLMVLTDYMIQKLIRLDFLEPLDLDGSVPNFDANVADKFRDPSYDPGNEFSVAYQSGFTGIGYNIALTGREITSLDDLWDPEFSGRIGMFREMRDSMNFALLRMGIEPTTATYEDAQRAQEMLIEQAPLVRNYYGNEYSEQLSSGGIALTMAWSGDVYQLQLDNPDLRFVIPDEGCNLWIDNMCIPKAAANPDGAHQMMNFMYRPEIMAQVCAAVQFIGPVPAARDVILASDDPDIAALADSQLIFPSDETLATVHGYPDLSDEAEELRWQELFNEVVQG